MLIQIQMRSRTISLTSSSFRFFTRCAQLILDTISFSALRPGLQSRASMHLEILALRATALRFCNGAWR